MPESNPIQYLKEAGGVFKFGHGVMGKSAIVVGVLMLAVVVGAWRLHSDIAIIASLVIGGLIFGGWFIKVLDFAGKHPDIAVLEGAEWSGYQRDQTAAKGYIPPSTDQFPQFAPGTVRTALPEQTVIQDEEK
jgi:hypothetical protein